MGIQIQEYITTEEELPEADQMCEVIGKNYSFENVKIHISSFSPVTGWKDLNQAFAWRPLSKKTTELIKKYSKISNE